MTSPPVPRKLAMKVLAVDEGTPSDGNKTESEPEPEPATKPARNPILRYDQVYDLRTSQTRLVKSAKSDLKARKNRKVVLIVRRIINEKGIHTETKIDIKSGRLAKALVEINSDVEDTDLQTTPPQASPDLFFHSKDALQGRLELARKEVPLEQELLDDLEIALKFIEEEHVITCENMKSLLAVGKITWEHMWALFPPNTLVYRYHHFTEEDQILRLRTLSKDQNQNMSWYWNFQCDIVADDGLRFGIAKEPLNVKIDEFNGARPIQDMPIFPLAYHKEANKLQQEATERGKRYVAITRPRVMQTSGVAMSEDRTNYWNPFYYKFATHGRAIVDPAAFRTYNPNLTLIPHVHRSLSRDELTEEQLMICTPVALGFSLGDKRWGGLAMSRLRDISWNQQAFQQLVMNKESKMLVHALVRQHSFQNEGIDDLISGKGKGLVGMFSGSPGCGKTLTVEAVAEVTRKPLYAVSAGELGITPTEVDEKLARVLELADKWDAVLLLDEADVFLQERNSYDVTRNALVSIFLRQLEYFEGILIMTTNRIENCDPAFKSRIHIRIEYPELDEAARKQIWETFLGRARGFTNDLRVEVSNDELNELCRILVNGRQIKNIAIGARTLAKELNETLSMNHIRLVLGIVAKEGVL